MSDPTAFRSSEPQRAARVLRAIGLSCAALVEVDEARVVRWWSDGAARLFGYDATVVEGMRWEDVGVASDPVRRRQAVATLNAVLKGSGHEGEWIARRADGTAVAVRTVYQPLLADDGRVEGAVMVTVDVSGRDRYERALIHEALHDPLTGLPNRTMIIDALSRIAGDPQRASSSVLFVDIDEFKSVNDRYGHSNGDRVLVEVGTRLRSMVRDQDLVGRLAGDEFVLVFPGTPPERAVEAAERIAGILLAPISLEGTASPLRVSASVGVTSVSPGDDPEHLLAKADRAMYQAKGDTPGGYAVIIG
jgi:diguanylate cyclase (GGDEF)-like protein/PAS domain S-box-containing protein